MILLNKFAIETLNNKLQEVTLYHGLKIKVFYFLYISQIFQMNRISFMVVQVNAVLLIHWFYMGD